MGLSDDEDLKRAIAMSLEEQATVPVVDLVDSDSDDAELRQAIALSLQDNGNATASTHAKSGPSSSAPPLNAVPSLQLKHDSLSLNDDKSARPAPDSVSSTVKAATSLSGIFNMDRKAMEQERLARLGKRKRTPSPARPSKLVSRAPGRPTTASKTVTSENQPKSLNSTGVQYPHGAIKRTWANKHARANDIRIEEVLQNESLNIAVLSAFQWEDQWLVGQPNSNDPKTCKWMFGKLDPRKTKQVWVVGKKGEKAKELWMEDLIGAQIPQLKSTLAPMEGQIQSMHSKYMLLFHDTHLRIVVSTANMVHTDWGETSKDVNGQSTQPGVMENSVFLVDLPRRSDDRNGAKEDLTSFGKELVGFLDAQGLSKNVVEGVMKFDFAATENLAFVHSIPGKCGESFLNRTGLPGLAKAIRQLGLDKVKNVEIDYAASSLGALNPMFLSQLYNAVCGQAPSTNTMKADEILDRFRIYFPSRETVVNSTGGAACGGIINLDRSYYKGDFPKKCMREYKSTRAGLLSHNKIMLVRGNKADDEPFAWVYIGSANLSESAWGSEKILKSGKPGKSSLRNWECGIIMQVPGEQLRGINLERDPMGVFAGTIDIPFQYPGEQYDGKEPWFFKEHNAWRV